MTDDRFLLTFELTPDKDELEIHMDEKGLAMLRRQLDVLSSRGGHVNLKTPGWGGAELTVEPQADGHVVLNHVRVFLWQSGR